MRTWSSGLFGSVAALALLAPLVLCSAAAGGAATSDGPAPPHYDLHLRLDPARQHVEVSGHLRFTVATDTLAAVDLLLHGELAISSWSLDRAATVRRDSAACGVRYQPEATWIRLRPAEPLRRGEDVAVAFSYAGRITAWPEWSANVLGADWTEIGLYFPWFPYHPDLAPFTYDLTVSTDPTYTVHAMGESRSGDGATDDGTVRRFVTTEPNNDIVVVAARDLQVRDAGTVQVVHRNLEPAMVDSLAVELEATRRIYAGWFGPAPGGLTLVSSSRTNGGGYSRRGGLYLANLDTADYFARREAYLRYLGHELAHLWWHRADPGSWEDWLNESFAEYSALMAVRERFGADRMAARLATKRDESADTPPIHGFDRNDTGHAEQVLYGKGPLLLAELEDRIGTARFLPLLRDTHRRGVAATGAFLALLTEREGAATAAWFAEELRTR